MNERIFHQDEPVEDDRHFRVVKHINGKKDVLDETELLRQTGISHIADAAFDIRGHLLVCGYGEMANPLLAKYAQTWEAQPLDDLQGRYVKQIAVDAQNQVWYLLRTIDQRDWYQYSIGTVDNGSWAETPVSINGNYFTKRNLWVDHNLRLWLWDRSLGVYSFRIPELQYCSFDDSKMVPKLHLHVIQQGFEMTGRRTFADGLQVQNELWVSIHTESSKKGVLLRYRSKENQTAYEVDYVVHPYMTRLRDGSILSNGKNGYYLFNEHTNDGPLLINLPIKGDITSAVQEPNGTLWIGIENPIKGKTVLRYRPDRVPPNTRFTASSADLFPEEQITFEWTGAEKFKPKSQSLRYAWRIDDDEWSPYSKETRLSLTHGEIASGKHILQVKTRDSGFDDDTTPASFAFVVHAVPIQNQAWFMPTILITFIIILLLTGLLLLSRIKVRQYAMALEGIVETRSKELKTTQSHLLEISEREQTRIGHELHDGVVQDLTAAAIVGSTIIKNVEEYSTKDAKEVRELIELIDNTTLKTRQLARGLSPINLDEIGLLSALKTLAVQISKQYGLICECVFSSDIRIQQHEKEHHLYRIIQEAATNAAKHARADNIVIFFTTGENALIITVEDNGCGFDIHKRNSDNMGVEIMKYRAKAVQAELDIRSQPGEGTKIVCKVPLP